MEFGESLDRDTDGAASTRSEAFFLLLLDRLSAYMPLPALARHVIPNFWPAFFRAICANGHRLHHVWAAQCEDVDGKSFHIVPSNVELGDELELPSGWKGRVISKFDLLPDIFTVTESLERMRSERLPNEDIASDAESLQELITLAAGGQAAVTVTVQ